LGYGGQRRMYRVAAETRTGRAKRLVGESCVLKILSEG
jgi:hypothetical protein